MEETLFLQLTAEELEYVALGLYLLQNVAVLWNDPSRVDELSDLAEKTILAGKAQEFFSEEAMKRLDQYRFPGDDE